MHSGEDPKPGSGYEFIDLFAGIGGFHEALSNLGAKCVFASEWNAAARKTYKLNHFETSPNVFADDDKYFNTDITAITQAVKGSKNDPKVQEAIREAIPPFDVLCAGFPCQPFSQAGHKLGFDDERGNLFFDIEKILYARKPKAIFLENVRHLLKHDNEQTIEEIRGRLEKAGYGKVWEFVVKASDHGLPQHRPRVFIIGIHDDFEKARVETLRVPKRTKFIKSLAEILGGTVYMPDGKTEREIGFTLRVGGKQSPIEDRRNWDGYIIRPKDGGNKKVVRLTPMQGLQLQGFPIRADTKMGVRPFRFPKDMSHSDCMKQLGNSVAVPAIQDYAAAIFGALNLAYGSPRKIKK